MLKPGARRGRSSSQSQISTFNKPARSARPPRGKHDVSCCIQGNALIEQFTLIYGFGKWTKNRLSVEVLVT
jgi:hypothetical protein